MNYNKNFSKSLSLLLFLEGFSKTFITTHKNKKGDVEMYESKIYWSNYLNFILDLEWLAGF